MAGRSFGPAPRTAGKTGGAPGSVLRKGDFPTIGAEAVEEPLGGSLPSLGPADNRWLRAGRSMAGPQPSDEGEPLPRRPERETGSNPLSSVRLPRSMDLGAAVPVGAGTRLGAREGPLTRQSPYGGARKPRSGPRCLRQGRSAGALAGPISSARQPPGPPASLRIDPRAARPAGKAPIGPTQEARP